jgi:hypothetical protein
MKYRVVLSIPATVTITVEVEAESQEAAIVSGYDHAMSATPGQVQVSTLHAQSAMLESCEQTQAEPETAVDVVPPSPHQMAAYLLQRFFTPESQTAGTPDVVQTITKFDDAVAECELLGQVRNDYKRRVVDKLGNILHERTNMIGRYVVVAFSDKKAFEALTYRPWAGWVPSAKEAKLQALALLDAGKVYAVGVLSAATADSEEKLIMKLSRSSES